MLTVEREAGSDGIDAPSGTAHRNLRLLLVDDHRAVRSLLARVLEDEPGFELVDVCETGEQAVARAEQGDVDVAVVDYSLGGHNGLWVTRRLRQLDHPPRVLVFSAFAHEHLAASCVVAGADGLLTKGSLGSELCDAIRALAAGRRVIPPVSQAMADMLRRRLAGIEQQIFGMRLAGIPLPEMEQVLRMSSGERQVREAAMLNKLEALPGETPAERDDAKHSLGAWPRSWHPPFNDEPSRRSNGHRHAST